MLSHSNAQYVIKTRAGQKGPFTHQQICKLVINGKLDESVSVRETASNTAVLVADIVSGLAYSDSLENEALAVSIDLIQEGAARDGTSSHVGLRSPISEISGQSERSSTSIHRRSQTRSQTKSHRAAKSSTSTKRHELSSRIFKHDSAESVQRGARVSRRERKQKMLVLSGIVVGICLIIALVLLLIPRGSVQGTWHHQGQELHIGSSVLKLQEGEHTLIHANYQRSETTSGTVFSVQEFASKRRCTIRVISVSPSTLVTSQDGAPSITWQR